MLQLRPNCENCNKRLPADSEEAMICSYECTFCRTCVSEVLFNVCPNCGGGFCQRPVRPKQEWQEGVSLKNQPPQTQDVLKPIEPQSHQEFADTIKDIPPHLR